MSTAIFSPCSDMSLWHSLEVKHFYVYFHWFLIRYQTHFLTFCSFYQRVECRKLHVPVTMSADGFHLIFVDGWELVQRRVLGSDPDCRQRIQDWEFVDIFANFSITKTPKYAFTGVIFMAPQFSVPILSLWKM